MINNFSNIINHPILSNQKYEANLVLIYGKELINDIKKVRNDLDIVIIIDVVVKLFRINICSIIECNSCKKCSPIVFMNEKKFKKFIQEKKVEILDIISSGFNNSFNVPQRGMIFQYVVDKVIPKQDSIIYFEIGCGGGLIGKVLTNSNHSKKYFSKSPFNWNIKSDNRKTSYIGIDPNLILGEKQQLCMVNGNTDEMQLGRDTIREVYLDKGFINDNIILKKMLLEKNNFADIINEISLYYGYLYNQNNIHFIFLTSTMRYYFKTTKSNIEFDNLILEFSNELSNKFKFRSIGYISNEIYGEDGLLYPSESKKYLQTSTKYKKIGEFNFKNELDFPELSYKF